MATVKRKGNKQPADDPALKEAAEKAVEEAKPVGDLADKLARSRRP